MAKDIKLTELREEFKRLEKEEKDQGGNLEQFVIMPDRAERQLLHINLIPTGIVYIRGQKIYSNTSQIKMNNQGPAFNFWNLLLKRDNPLSMVINDTNSVQILGIKHPAYSGQILILDLSVYKQSFYYSLQHLIASKRAFLKQQSTHPILSELRLIQHKNKLDNIFDALDVNQQTIVLQGESTIMEKYLAEDEQFYIYNRKNLIAVSKEVKLQLVREGRGFGVKAKGKGWLFYQTNKSQIKLQNGWNKFLLYLFIISFVTSILQQILQI